MSYYLNEIKNELDTNNTLPNLSTEIASISSDLFDSLDGRTFTAEDQQTAEKILTHIRKKKSDIISRDSSYKALEAKISAYGPRGTLSKKEKKELSNFKQQQTTLEQQFKTPTAWPISGTITADVDVATTNLNDIERKYKNLYQHYRKYKPQKEISKNIAYKTSSNIVSGDDIFHVTTPSTYTLSHKKIQIGDQEYENNLTIGGININSSGNIGIDNKVTIKHKGKKIPRDQDIKITYIATATATVVIDPTTTPPLTKDIIYEQPYTITLEADPTLVAKKEQKEKKKKEGKEKQQEKNNIIPAHTGAKSKTEKVKKSKKSRTKKIGNTVKGTTHGLASTLTLPLHGSLALAKGIKQSIHATVIHGIVDSIKKAGNKQGRERYLSGFTFGGYNLGKATLNMLKRVPEAALSGFSPAYSSVSDTVKRKRDYTTRKKKGVFARIGESISQIGSDRSYQQPKDRVPTIIPTDFPKTTS